MNLFHACRLVVFLVGLMSFEQAFAQDVRIVSLPSSAWSVLERARGIDVGGSATARPSIQIIFDANCPYCARLYEKLRRDHPDLAVRWVPIAYFRSDSALLAMAILNSREPATSLRKNFDSYDYKAHRGGYQTLSGSPQASFGKPQFHLTQYWKKWGGYTPMYVFRDNKGQIQMTGGSAEYIVKKVIKMSAPALSTYQPSTPSD